VRTCHISTESAFQFPLFVNTLLIDKTDDATSRDGKAYERETAQQTFSICLRHNRTHN